MRKINDVVNNGLINVVSFSGGRSSAYLVNKMEVHSFWNNKQSRNVFMDTGLEHPGTYKFIRNIINEWDIPIDLIRVVYDERHGKPSTYRLIKQDELRPDLEGWVGMLKKYGTPYFGGARCTDRMKQAPFLHYCKDNFGRKKYNTWLGIRFDEPARLWGEKNHKALKDIGYCNEDASTLFIDAIRYVRESESDGCLYVKTKGISENLAGKLLGHIKSKVADNLYYLAEISDYTKPDIIKWWGAQSFDLEIDEHLGNCVFCIKKSLPKVALAAMDEPQLAKDYWAALTSNEVKIEESRIGRHLQMYRKKNTFLGVIGMFSMHERDELAARLRSLRSYESGSCSESCEPFLCSTKDDAA
ncbi:phosphoadenosine phosphosulfate reductase family protein [Dickeya undicola]|uniref:phosphoadenosine phosphosulfate reductase family protein n=1 Tax=Dickeya undicola TaxID=1577887 RepID=UPI003F236375